MLRSLPARHQLTPRLSQFPAILDTVYPGQRSDVPGSFLTGNHQFGLLLGGPWNDALKNLDGTAVLGPNQSQSPSFFELGLIFLPRRSDVSMHGRAEPSGTTKRLDIRGLRAIAVLHVIFFNLPSIGHLPGGFVGLDVFFVISGFVNAKTLRLGFATQECFGICKSNGSESPHCGEVKLP